MMNKLAFLLFATVLISCTKIKSYTISTIQNKISDTEIGIAVMSSKEDLRESINSPAVRSESINFYNLHTPVNNFDIEKNPILSVDYELSEKQVSANSNKSVYEALSFDDYIPNEKFASLLNAKAEIEVNDTIYKISKRGTYYFHKSLRQIFENNYRTFATKEATRIGKDLYSFKNVTLPNYGICSNIYLYDTFGNITQSYSKPEQSSILNTRGGRIYTPDEIQFYKDERWAEALNLDWNNQDTYYTDAKTIAGKLIQGMFGRNKSFETYFNSKRRLSAKLYYYNYVGYSEIGGEGKMQKKAWLGIWNRTDAEKLFLIWSNIVLEAKLPFKVKYPHTDNGFKRIFIGEQVEEIPLLGIKGIVAYFAGSPLSEDELNFFAQADYMKAIKNLKIDIGENNLSNRYVAAKFLTEDREYMVLYPYGVIEENTYRINRTFNKDLHFIVGIKNFTVQTPKTVNEWIQKIVLQVPGKPELLQGEIRIAAKYNGELKGIRLIK